MTLGYIGLGKMGLNMVTRLAEKGHKVVAFAATQASRDKAKAVGAEAADSIAELVKKLPAPRTFWIMVPHTVVDSVLNELAPNLEKGDTIVDGGNSFYKNSIRRAETLAGQGIHFLDAGVSGGPNGARNGACIMVGGEKSNFDKLVPLFKDLTVDKGFVYAGKSGAGHFVKMVHNGIEYGMMQALAEGFAVMKKSEFNLNLKAIAELYNHGSVIESRLVTWLTGAFEEYGEDLESVSAAVAHSGEGEWTVKTAGELGVPTPVIKDAFDFRVESAKNPSFMGKILSALRNQFGGHSVGK